MRGLAPLGKLPSSFLPRGPGRQLTGQPMRARARAFPGFRSSGLSPALAGDIDRLDADMDRWNADMDRLDADLDRWSADLESSAVDRAQLIADMERLTADVETLSADVDKVDADVEYLLDDMASLQSPVSLSQTIGQALGPTHSHPLPLGHTQLVLAASEPVQQPSTALLPAEEALASSDIIITDDNVFLREGGFLSAQLTSAPATRNPALVSAADTTWPSSTFLEPSASVSFLSGMPASRGYLLTVGGPRQSSLLPSGELGQRTGPAAQDEPGVGGSSLRLGRVSDVAYNEGPLLSFGGLQPFTDSEVAGLIFGAFIIACAAAAPSLDRFFAEAQRRDLGLCNSCGGVEWVPCPKCKGPADASKVTQSQVCQLCDGKGRILCPLCQGNVIN